ncbi:glycosyltransferase family 4 protein [Candidatus Woesearchaeota archaeon]|nr:glycosyltransferase family 4 protein [Candidatus Woesearchaeota archaeon]
MKVLMFGWEFPPLNSGGLGTACYGLTKALSSKGVKITFVLPKSQESIKVDFMKILIANNISNVDLKFIDSLLSPYISYEEYDKDLSKLKEELKDTFNTNPEHLIYGNNLFKEVIRYTKEAEKIAVQEDYDIIHCHDWMTFGAGIKAKRISRLSGKVKPLILHVHATEFDRTGGNPNQIIYEIEKFGMESADHIITVSNYTKNLISYKYGISKEKISVVYNGLEANEISLNETFNLKKHYKIVLYLGRITLQKGPDWFLKVAKKVSDKNDDIKFVIAGNGDMFPRIVEESAYLGIANSVFFTNFLRGIDIDRAYEMADLYVMPSVSEPFGITALEALNKKTPIIVSKQSGVAEVINNCYKIDFWDTWKIADSIIEILHNEDLHKRLSENGYEEVKKLTWDTAADSCLEVYNKFIINGGIHNG